MPSFFEGLKRVVQGKPVFEASDSSGQSSSPGPAPETAGPRPTPRVQIEEVKSSMNGSRLECRADIRNYSTEDVMLDKIRMLGGSREIDSLLKAGEKKDFLIYSGEAPGNTGENDAELQYRDLSGKYFKARHDVRFRQQDDRYSVERMPYENTSNL